MMRYGLNAAIIAGEFCLAPGESVRTTGDRGGERVPCWYEMTPTKSGVKQHPDGRRVASNFVNRPWRCRPFEMALS
jgi:hypothetical protein